MNWFGVSINRIAVPQFLFSVLSWLILLVLVIFRIIFNLAFVPLSSKLVCKIVFSILIIVHIVNFITIIFYHSNI